MATLSVQTPVLAGLNPSYAACAGGGDQFAAANINKYLLHVKNAGVGSITVTLADQKSVAPANAQSFNANVQVTVPNGGERMIVLGPVDRFMDTNGNVQITYSGVTSVTIGVFQF
jgi:hypothetical protein